MSFRTIKNNYWSHDSVVKRKWEEGSKERNIRGRTISRTDDAEKGNMGGKGVKEGLK